MEINLYILYVIYCTVLYFETLCFSMIFSCLNKCFLGNKHGVPLHCQLALLQYHYQSVNSQWRKCGYLVSRSCCVVMPLGVHHQATMSGKLQDSFLYESYLNQFCLSYLQEGYTLYIGEGEQLAKYGCK